MKKIRFVPCPQIHSHQVRFTLNLVPDPSMFEEHKPNFHRLKSKQEQDRNLVNLPPIPTILVYANTCYEDQLKPGEKWRIKPRIHGTLQVTSQGETRDSVSGAVKAVLSDYDPVFQDYEIGADFTLTPVTQDEIDEIEAERESFRRAGWGNS